MAADIARVNGKAKHSTASHLAVAVLAGLGVALSAGPSHAFYKVNGLLIAKPTAGTVGGTDFNSSYYYRFDYQVTNNNSLSNLQSNSTTNAWVPTGSFPVFNYLTISRCGNMSIGSCSSPVTGVVNGSWNSSPTVTDLQEFVVRPLDPSNTPWTNNPSGPDTPSFSMSFGSSMGGTGLTSKFNTVANKPISDVQVGSYYNLSKLIPDGTVNWYPSGSTSNPSALTATNIITNLDLASMPFARDAVDSATDTQIAISFYGESGAVLFNVNSIEFTAVPGPLPVVGGLAAFGYSRKLRQRLKASTQS